jgi:ERCC4-type nuclease
MRIVVDSREKSLFDELKYTPPKSLRDYTTSAQARTCGIHLDGEFENQSASTSGASEPVIDKAPVVCKHEAHTLEKSRLVIGDATLRSDHDDNDADIILFERKTLTDLAASIRDGRYKEQSFRMNQYCELANHNIIYIIEGDMAKYADKTPGANPISKKALYSAMFRMLYLKGFSVFRTSNVRETADLILYFADKYDAVPAGERKPFYRNKTKPTTTPTKHEDQDQDPKQEEQQQEQEQEQEQEQQQEPKSGATYSSTFKHKERSSQIVPENIGEIMISAIPFVSSKTASAIMSEYKTITKLIEAMQKDRTCLNHIYTSGPSGNRKISKLCVDNLFKFLIA